MLNFQMEFFWGYQLDLSDFLGYFLLGSGFDNWLMEPCKTDLISESSMRSSLHQIKDQGMHCSEA
jgi:hypothetical protein